MPHKKAFTKKAPNIFCIQIQGFNISDIFYKVQNLKKWKMEAVVPFLPRNPKLHSPCVHYITISGGMEIIQAYFVFRHFLLIDVTIHWLQ